VIAVCLTACAFATDPNRLPSQYVHTIWGPEKGFPGGSISSIAQTSDGYLWIGTERGLVRFDGLSFRKFEQATPTALPLGPVKRLLADGQGNLWILLENTKLLRYHDEIFELSRGEAENGITAICRSTTGAVLVSSLARGTLAYDGKQFKAVSAGPVFEDPVARANGVPPDERNTRQSWSTGVTSHLLAAPISAVLSMAATADGKIWLGSEDKGLFLQSADGATAIPNGLPRDKITSILPVQGPELWIGTGRGVVRWTGTELTRSGVPPSLQGVQVLCLLRDRDSNIWIGTARGLLRYNASGVSLFSGEASETRTPVNALFEDREQNLWIGGPRGLERLRDSAFLTYSVADGLPSEGNGPVYVDTQGRTWFAPLEGGLHWIKGTQHGIVTQAGLDRDVVYSISGRDNKLWVGRQRGGLTVLRPSGDAFTAKTYTQADGLAQNSIYAVHEARDGTVWAGTLGSGVSVFKNGSFATYTTADGISSNMVSSIAESRDGTVWFATSSGLSAFLNGRWRVYTVKDGLPSADLNCVFVDSTGVVWIGSTAGIAFLLADHVQVPLEVPQALREPIFGIAEDRNGSLWIATSNHVVRVNRSGLLRTGNSDADVREYGLADGLLGTEGVKRQQSVVADPLGRIWFSMNRGLSVVDPDRASGNSSAALVQVETIMVDGNAVDAKLPVRISSASRRITFDYAGLSLSNPERVRYRYRLDGFDHDWSEPTTTKTAIYTNLSPGSYRFRVIASNSDGLWNGNGAAVTLAVTPTLWQTWWFRIGLVLFAGLATLIIYRLRMHHVTRLLNTRFEERLAERTRIAQDLHDTLLQGVLSASMQLHVGVDQLPDDSPARATLKRVVNLMGQVIDEGRNTLRGLRSPTESAEDMAAALSRVPQEFGDQDGVDFRVVVEGPSLPLRSVIRDDVYSIGREALVNAFRHSRATSIEVEVEYSPVLLTMVIRDNGSGIDPEMLKSGRDGHWGLSGMRERAERIGARVKVMSRPGSGTEVELRVPGEIAFESNASRPASKWFRNRSHKRTEKIDRPQGQRVG
jgi:ligand-binding sensor domain-containing protein/signal transduction histidine kinase